MICLALAQWTSGWKLHLDTLTEQELVNFSVTRLRTESVVGTPIGTTALSHDDRWWAIRCVHATGVERRVASFNAWHAICNCTGTRTVADTNFPDIGIQIFDPCDGIGEPTTLCYPEASSIGDHWNGPFPYAGWPVQVYALHHTHPHPSFSPDGRFVVYTSDRTGQSQVYEVEVSESLPHPTQ